MYLMVNNHILFCIVQSFFEVLHFRVQNEIPCDIYFDDNVKAFFLFHRKGDNVTFNSHLCELCSFHKPKSFFVEHFLLYELVRTCNAVVTYTLYAIILWQKRFPISVNEDFHEIHFKTTFEIHFNKIVFWIPTIS